MVRRMALRGATASSLDRESLQELSVLPPASGLVRGRGVERD